MRSGREEILARIRASLSQVRADASHAKPEVAAASCRQHEAVGGETRREEPGTRSHLQARLVEELQALGARVCVAADGTAAREYLVRLAAEKGGKALVARRPLVESLRLEGERFHPYGSFPAQEAALSITQADYALADTGTLILLAGAGEGRALSLLAPVNATLLPASRILSDLDELFRQEPCATERSSDLVFTTGPSRTADIELTLTIGVHGPGELHVVVLADT